MSGKVGSGLRISRRALVGGLAAPLVLPEGVRTGHAQSINKERVILGMTQEPVQFNPLLWVNAGTENVPESFLLFGIW